MIAAVEGFALGGGFEIVLACDLVVASDDAVFGLPEVKRGLVANCGAFFRAPDKLPFSVAMEMLLTGESISSARGAELGFVNRVTRPGDALAVAGSLAELICRNNPAAVAATLGAASKVREQRETAPWVETAVAVEQVMSTPDPGEGIAAFFDKREPVWAIPQRPYRFG